MKRFVLTIPQARNLQRHLAGLPEEERLSWGEWAFMAYERLDRPDVLQDPERMAIGVQMKRMGCEDEQLAEQLNWRPKGKPIETINAALKLLG